MYNTHFEKITVAEMSWEIWLEGVLNFCPSNSQVDDLLSELPHQLTLMCDLIYNSQQYFETFQF